MASRSQSEMAAVTDAVAMDLLSQLERLKITAERGGDMVLATRVAALLDDYLSRYCDGKRAALEETLRYRALPFKEHLH